jgi:monoterpene epsilon-lactone hydrolase
MKYVALSLLFLLVIVLAERAYSAKKLRVSEREIPVPASVSSELQSSILDMPPITRVKTPTNTAEWKVLQKSRNGVRSANIMDIANTLKVQIENRIVDGIPVIQLTPAIISPENTDRTFLYLHGGAYVFGKADAGLFEGIIIANRLNIPVVCIDYRMPPNAPFPAAIDDVIIVYQHMLETRLPGSIIIGGTSAGGGLAFAAVHKMRELELATPAAIYGGTPWVDLTKTGDTLFTNSGLDRILGDYDGLLKAAALLYAGGHDLRDKLLSPVYGEFEAFPPAFLVTGTRDLFLSDVARIHRKLRASMVKADLHVYEGMSHADYLVASTSPESLDLYRQLSAFVDEHLAKPTPD